MEKTLLLCLFSCSLPSCNAFRAPSMVIRSPFLLAISSFLFSTCISYTEHREGAEAAVRFVKTSSALNIGTSRMACLQELAHSAI